nr:hypothetical protein RAR13_04195 [Aminobacter aminovorans]
MLDKTDADGNSLWVRVPDRIYSVSEDTGKQILLNKIADLSSAVFGEMCLVEKKGLQALLELKASKVELSNLTIAEIYALQEKEAPAGSQFIRGMAYWLSVGDHLFFVKTNSMTSENIRAYIDWLLKANGSGLEPSSSVELQAEFDKSQVAGDIGDIRNLRVKGNAAPQFSVDTVSEGGTKEVATSKTVADRFVQFAQAVPVLNALLGEAKTRSLIDSLGPQEYLAVDASVKVKGRRTEKSKRELQEIANTIADITDGEVHVEGKFGKVSDGDAILRMRMPFNMDHEGANLLEFHNVADQLQEVYSRFVRDGKIPA